jgi:hypothetical protein
MKTIEEWQELCRPGMPFTGYAAAVIAEMRGGETDKVEVLARAMEALSRNAHAGEKEDDRA